MNQNNSWRNVTDEPPPNDKFILGYFSIFDQLKVCKIIDTEWYDDNENLIDDPDYYPSHWLPLPVKP